VRAGFSYFGTSINTGLAKYDTSIS